MTIINTSILLRRFLNKGTFTLETQNNMIIQPIAEYFSDQNQSDLHTLLLSHGLFHPEKVTNQQIEDLLKSTVWSFIDDQFNQLKTEWNGPDSDIFILPADLSNKKLIEYFNGVSGLNIANKIFLFIDAQTSKQALAAILAHEYSHTVRLNHLHKNSEGLKLKDTIVLEGIATVITEEKFGHTLLPNFDDRKETVSRLWSKWIEPNLTLSINHPLHHYIMYGNSHIPELTGYLVGFLIVKKWYTKHQTNLTNLLYQPTDILLRDIEL